jgi:uroporphyrinogen decarboxylase
VTASRFLCACRGEAVDAVPIWLMRQAGRYMPEYQALRADHSFETLLTTPELACRITLQPVHAFGVDAAIVFSDILPLLRVMGVPLRFDDAAGPQLEPLKSDAALRPLGPDEIRAGLGFTLEAERLAKRELEPLGVPLIGFSGAPFTLACYALEGRIGHDCLKTRALMLAEPRRWDELLGAIAEAVGHYLLAQVEAGVDALQLFDTWAGALSAAEYERHVLPHVRRAVAMARSAGVPVVYFSTQTGGMIDTVARTGADIIGVDWRCDLAAVRRRLGPSLAVQGNLDPAALTAPWEVLRECAVEVLRAAAPGGPGFIFNLGHGVPPATPPDNVRRLVELVHTWRED